MPNLGMDDELRAHIVNNTERLIACTDYGKLVSACVQAHVLTPKMRENVENILPSPDKKHEQHKRLFLKLTKRGPTAYQKLIEILGNLRCTAAVNVLNEQRAIENFQSINNNNKTKRPPTIMRQEATEIIEDQEEVDHEQPQTVYKDLGRPKLQLHDYIEPKNIFHVKKSISMQSDSKIASYSMKTKKNRGVLFMVNNIDFMGNPKIRRNGAESDADSLLHLFKELGFKLFSYNNLTHDQFKDLLSKLINSDYTRDTECFVLALMSHGSSVDTTEYVQFSDNAEVKVNTIENMFANAECPNLIDKPKILLFPFCRGSIPDRGIQVKNNIQTDGYGFGRRPTLSDMLVCYACSLGFEAHRDQKDGSWYIQALCKIMSENAWNTDFEVIIKKVQEETGKLRTGENAMQTGGFKNIGFNKKLFFNPGYSEND